jgi:hypothetical protein
MAYGKKSPVGYGLQWDGPAEPVGGEPIPDANLEWETEPTELPAEAVPGIPVLATAPEGASKDTEPLYTKAGGKIGPMERVKLESEAKTGVEASKWGAVGRLAADVVNAGNARLERQNINLQDVAKGTWQEYEPVEVSATMAGPAIREELKTFTFADASEPTIDRKLSAAGLDPVEVRAAASKQAREYDAAGKPYSMASLIGDAAQFRASELLRERTHVKARAQKVLEENKPGFGYSAIGGTLENLPYMAQFTLGSLSGTGPVLPLIAAYDKYTSENRASKYAFDPSGNLVETKAGKTVEEAVLPSALGAVGEVGIETAGGKLLQMGLGKIATKFGAQKILKTSPALRRLVNGFGKVSKVTKMQG